VIKSLPAAVRLYLGSAAAAVTALVVAFAPHSVVAGFGYWTVALICASLYLAHRANQGFLSRIEDQQRHVQQMSDVHLATIEALALAIDAKDQVGQRHMRRMQVYAAGLARVLGMSETDIQGVNTASLLHDIGKLAVPEHILSKPGPLTQEEFQKIRMHPQVGAEIIGGVPFPYPVAPLILSHHERWDGNGYPEGLSGDGIPLGARILSLVDYFDALISERPHQRAVSVDAALALLQEESGRALDPRVVEAFIAVYPTLDPDAIREPSPMRLNSVGSSRSMALHTQADADGAGQSDVFHDIALAHREIHALYEIAEKMGGSLGVSDTMARIASKLSNLVPFSCCALFLRTNETGLLRCRFASGTDAELIQDLTIHDGQGLAGRYDVHTSLKSALVCRLAFNGLFIGTISVYHTTPSVYTDDHRRLLDRISEQAAAVIHHSIVFEQMQEDSLTDPMTGLPNTRYMFMHLARELARAGRLHSHVSLLVMDLDRFKGINDTYGHQAGDRALCEVGGALRAATRPYDICVRYAGDEFIVVLPGCGGEEAEHKRLELQRAIDELRFEVRPGEWLALAISAGAAVFPHDGESYEALLATADSRMYRDKTARNRLSTASGPQRPDLASGSEGLSDIDLTRAASGIL
jgi:diguanylate cyclase (GGDEF)-like protein